MANEKHQAILMQGVEVWNAWRSDSDNNTIHPDFRGADFQGVDLNEANLMHANFERANLEDAEFFGANLGGANLTKANLVKASLLRTNLASANLGQAKLGGSYLLGADLLGADLTGADLAGVRLGSISGVHGTQETMLCNVDLSTTRGLNDCQHMDPSCVDHRTIARSKNVPGCFWRGCGLPDTLIDYMLSLSEEAIQFYSCFISYSSKDQEFAERLHADLQNVGVRCWFAPHDLPIGRKILDGLDEAVRMRDKVLLILSNNAIASDWVEDEVTMAFGEERRRKKEMLFSVRLDDAVLETNEPWAVKLRDNRHIGDFTRWKEHDAYKATFERVLRDLRAGR
ncbi:MAG: toll/interleukin-1 receptor domain-containing protein [Pseudomonadota bacterium]